MSLPQIAVDGSSPILWASNSSSCSVAVAKSRGTSVMPKVPPQRLTDLLRHMYIIVTYTYIVVII